MGKRNLDWKASRVPQKPRALHCKKGVQACPQCWWQKHKSDVPSWLQGVVAPSGSLHVGCIICRKAGYTATPYGSFPEATMALLRGWKKHSKQPCLVAATQPSEGVEPAERQSAPAVDDFKSLWMALRKNRQDVEEAASPIFRAKARKMLYCLAEAVRFRQRIHLRGSSCMTLSLDACKTRLLRRHHPWKLKVASLAVIVARLQDIKQFCMG